MAEQSKLFMWKVPDDNLEVIGQCSNLKTQSIADLWMNSHDSEKAAPC